MIKSIADGKGKMPAFKGKLTDEQIKDSVTYFRALEIGCALPPAFDSGHPTIGAVCPLLYYL